jgi:hypothetical protein
MSVPTMFGMFSLAEQITSARGAKTCQLTKAGKKVQLQPTSEAVAVPFPPSTFDKDEAATRLTLELRCNRMMLCYFDAFDDWAKTYLHVNSMKLFKKQLSEAQILEGYHPTVKRHPQGTYEPLLRCKIDTTGRREVSYWTPEGDRREAPTDWRRVTVIPQLEIVSLWNMSRELGFVIQCNALRVFEESLECPFAAGEDETESMDQ